LHINAVYVNTGQHMQMSLTIPGGLREEEVREHREHLENTTFLGVFNPDEDASGVFDVGDDYDGPGDPEFDCHDALAGLDDPEDDEDDQVIDMSDLG
jgi:hypothetical protein